MLPVPWVPSPPTLRGQHSLAAGGVHQQRDERGGGGADTVESQHGILALLLADNVICKEEEFRGRGRSRGRGRARARARAPGASACVAWRFRGGKPKQLALPWDMPRRAERCWGLESTLWWWKGTEEHAGPPDGMGTHGPTYIHLPPSSTLNP